MMSIQQRFAVFYAIYTLKNSEFIWMKIIQFVRSFNAQNKNIIEVAFDLKIFGY